jgi:hypothetical protein
MIHLLKRTTAAAGMAALLCVASLSGETGILAAEETEPTIPTASPLPTQMPTASMTPAPSVSPTAKKRIHLKKPTGVKILQRTPTTITLRWKKVKKAQKYEIYCKKKGAKTYKKIASTKKLIYKSKKRKEKTVYYYKVFAVRKDRDGKRIQSRGSNVKKAVTKPKINKIAYVGDSVMCGMANYLNNKKKGRHVIGKIGISPWNFWRGEYMDKVLAYNPDRIYIMLGVNSLVGTPSRQHCDGIIADYKKIIKICRKNNPDVEIIILSVAPCTAGCRETSNSYINMYNKKLKQMAKKKRLLYYDFSSEFKDSTGYLKKEYNGGDGLHWSAAGCVRFKQLLKAYNKTLK